LGQIAFCLNFQAAKGSYMEDGKAVWKYGMQLCGESGACLYVCPVGAIDWSYPEAGTGIVMKYS
jgi:ferredoxin-like protein FixX